MNIPNLPYSQTSGRDPKLTIVTITSNNLAELKETVASVRAQTAFHDIEHIIVDGNSTDGTTDFLETLTHCKWISESDNGIYDAMNKGLGFATAPYICFLNAGDHLANETAIELLLPHLANDRIVFGDADLEFADFAFSRPNPQYVGNGPNWYVTHLPSHQATFLPTALHRKYPYDANLRIVGDTKAMIGMLSTSQWVYVQSTLVRFSLGGLSSYYRSFSQALLHAREQHLHLPGRAKHAAATYAACITKYLLQRILPARLYFLIVCSRLYLRKR